MYTLIKREISGFFSSIIGYIVIIVFLLANSLFMWIIPGELNILDNGYSNVDTLFIIAPWVFMFLVPAITMRLFAEEKRLGTIELLLTRPIADIQIVFAKYIAGLALVIFSLIPTITYYISVYLLGDPVGNIDSGGFWGSFIGLFFLGGIYVSICLFVSSLAQNQIILFLLLIVLSFIFFVGFDTICKIGFLSSIDSLIVGLGITEHYMSMSRGVIDTRDILYFLGVITAFIFATKLVLESRKW